MSYFNRENVSILIGKTLTDVSQHGDDEIIFTTSDGEKYRMYHEQDCCENVSIESINGDLSDLIGSPITLASERTSCDYQSWETKPTDDDYGDSFTWTFYSFATIKGYVDIRWHGVSNGYYSESVDFEKI